jgi:hypothetical protein
LEKLIRQLRGGEPPQGSALTTVEENQVGADKRNRDAYMSAEMARLFIEIKSDTIAKIVGTYGRWDKSESMFGEEVETPGVGYCFKNIGKSFAIIKELSNQLVFETDFPMVPVYTIRDTLPNERVVMPGQYSAIMGCMMQDNLTVGKCVEFQKRIRAFWFYGYVKFDDVFGREHEWRYRFCWKRGYDGFRLDYFDEFPDDSVRKQRP